MHQTQPEIRCMQYRCLLPEGGNIPKLAYSSQPKVVRIKIYCFALIFIAYNHFIYLDNVTYVMKINI